MANLSGRTVGRYQILEPLGQGGMATVYKALDTRLEREVAIKFIRMELVNEAQKEEILKRFAREAKALGRLSHPNIVTVHDFGEFEGAPYLVMEFLPSGTLKSMVGKPMHYAEAARLLIPIADALHFAHQNGIVHRDIKPANILLTASGKPMLSDFGIAKVLDSGDALSLTPTGVGIGTPEYMSPEQGLGRAVDFRADIYSLGVVFYELITGKKPYSADTPMALVIKHVSDPLPQSRDSVPGLPEAVEHILSKAMAKKPEDRYQDMAEMEKALEDVNNLAATFRRANVVENLEETQTRVIETQTPGEIKTRLHPKPLPKVEKPGDEVKRQKTSLLPWLLGGAALIFVCLLSIVGIGIATKGFGLINVPKPAETTAAAALLSKTTSPTKGDLKTAVKTKTASLTIPNTPAPTKPILKTVGITASLTTPKTPTPSITIQTAKPTESPIPTLGIGSTLVSKNDGMVLLYVPQGEFLMGAVETDLKAKSEEKPQHKVWLDAFWIDRTEVTNASFQKCVEAGKCIAPYSIRSATLSSYYDNSDYANYPVIFVDWNQAYNYCRWAGRRLPSEAEWEKAARGEDGRIFPWGNSDPNSSLLNYNQDVRDTTETGKYPEGASVYGALDMAGNVWEWVNDWFSRDYYKTSPEKNPTGPISGDFKVMRGGSWDDAYGYASTFFRAKNTYSYWNHYVGFRCAASP